MPIGTFETSSTLHTLPDVRINVHHTITITHKRFTAAPVTAAMNGAQAAVAAASASQLPLITFDKRRINTRLAITAVVLITIDSWSPRVASHWSPSTRPIKEYLIAVSVQHCYQWHRSRTSRRTSKCRHGTLVADVTAVRW